MDQLNQTKKNEVVSIDGIVCEAIFDFAGFLATTPKPVTIGEGNSLKAISDLVTEWIDSRGLTVDTTSAFGWSQIRMIDHEIVIKAIPASVVYKDNEEHF